MQEAIEKAKQDHHRKHRIGVRDRLGAILLRIDPLVEKPLKGRYRIRECPYVICSNPFLVVDVEVKSGKPGEPFWAATSLI